MHLPNSPRLRTSFRGCGPARRAKDTSCSTCHALSPQVLARHCLGSSSFKSNVPLLLVLVQKNACELMEKLLATTVVSTNSCCKLSAMAVFRCGQRNLTPVLPPTSCFWKHDVLLVILPCIATPTPSLDLLYSAAKAWKRTLAACSLGNG